MTTIGSVLNLKDIVIEDQLGTSIAKKYIEWNMLRQPQVADWKEIRKYVYATDTTQTTNVKLPWKNKTTLPKLCQIRDNLFANYMASSFPKRKWLTWEANETDANSVEKRDAILNYMSWVISQPAFKHEVSKLLLDYIDYGNVVATVEWFNGTQELPDKTQIGYVGPLPKRISPLDIVFNPIATQFENSPKIVRTLLTLGEIKEMMESLGVTPEEKKQYTELFNYVLTYREQARGFSGEINVQDAYYAMDGFTSFRSYLESDYVELLTFYGDMYDYHNNVFYKNHIITVIDRHKVISNTPNPSYFGFPTFVHAAWRKRQDNLWGMGPLNNLVGMQYRIDHIENLKADVYDLIAFPPLKVKGYVEDFKWAPFEKIVLGDENADVEIMAPPWNVLQANQEIAQLMAQMEEMAGSPKEAMGFRTPGEKTAYEVQRLESAASRIFQNKIAQFEELVIERLLNMMLELARRNITQVQSIPVFNSDFNSQQFMELTAEDITGAGRIRPIAARHFAEKAEMVQNLTSFMGSPLGQDPSIKVHWSAYGLSRLFEDLLDVKDFQLVQPYIRLSEEADAQRLAQIHQEKVQMEGQTPSGLTPDDYTQNADQQPQAVPGAGAPGVQG